MTPPIANSRPFGFVFAFYYSLILTYGKDFQSILNTKYTKTKVSFFSHPPLFLLTRFNRALRAAGFEVVDGLQDFDDVYGVADHVDDVVKRLVCHRGFVERAFADARRVDARHFLLEFFEREALACRRP